MKRGGYVLVGGKSSRMGRDKALLPNRGAPLVRSVVSAVQGATGSALLVGNPALYARLGLDVIPDLFPGEGPLGGIVTALEHSRAEWNLITACDMPGLSAEFLRALLDAAEASGYDLLAPAGPSGEPEPLCAVYSSRLRSTLAAAFGRGARKARDVFNLAGAGVVHFQQASYFQNVNTPEEWAIYAAGRS